MNAKPAEADPGSVNETALNKEQHLRAMMRETGAVLVAYSGGVDSAYLALIATQELGESAVCMMGLSPSVSQFQRDEGASTAKEFGFNFVTVETSELDDPSYAANPQNRCFFCKSELYSRLAEEAAGRGIGMIADGANADDLTDHRPGREAAAAKGVRSPLAEIGFTKAEIRERSRQLALSTWDKPASPCLSSRIAYGVPVTIERLGRIERAEAYLRSKGFREFRVRVHGELARIEIGRCEMIKIFDLDEAGELALVFKKLGFKYVTLDLEGFRSGAMNEELAIKQKNAIT